MHRLKTNAWCPPPVSKVLSIRWSLLEETEISPFVWMVPFLCACVNLILIRGLWEFLHILIIILIQFVFYSFIPYNSNKGVFQTTRFQDLDSHHKMEFSIISRAPLLKGLIPQQGIQLAYFTLRRRIRNQ